MKNSVLFFFALLILFGSCAVKKKYYANKYRSVTERCIPEVFDSWIMQPYGLKVFIYRYPPVKYGVPVPQRWMYLDSLGGFEADKPAPPPPYILKNL